MHRESVVWEQTRHEIEEVVIVIPKDDCLQRYLCKNWFESRRELALGFPALCHNAAQNESNSTEWAATNLSLFRPSGPPGPPLIPDGRDAIAIVREWKYN